MAKLESTFKNMVLSLVIISMVAAGALAGVYILTLESINAQKIAKQEAAKKAVLAGHEDGTAIEAAVDGLRRLKHLRYLRVRISSVARAAI